MSGGRAVATHRAAYPSGNEPECGDGQVLERSHAPAGSAVAP